jgi:hypothetical protein
MALQYSVDVRNARLDVVETTIGTSPILRIRTGTPPANCAAGRTGTILASLTLPSDWMEAAGATTAGEKGKAGTWEDLSADATGTAGHFEVMNSAGTVCHMQGTVTATGLGGDMTVDNTSIASGQQVVVTSFKLVAGNP